VMTTVSPALHPDGVSISDTDLDPLAMEPCALVQAFFGVPWMSSTPEPMTHRPTSDAIGLIPPPL